MSHWTTVKTNIKSLGHLATAAAELGLMFVQGRTGERFTAVGYNGAEKECLAKITNKPGSTSIKYDIAIDKNPDGTFGLTTDWFDHKAKIVGQDFKKLNQLYAVHATMAAVKAKGWTATKRTLKDGTIQVVASGM